MRGGYLMADDFFQGIMRWTVERNSITRTLPGFYYDHGSLAAICTASTRRVRRLIPHPDLIPIELTPGRCLVAFAAFEYRKTDYGPYNEVSISFLASHRKRPFPLITPARVLLSRVIPSYVWQLPVTTEIARAGGVELFGYPKFIADIDFSKSTEQVTCSLSVSGSDILRMSGRVLPTKRGKPRRYLTYAVDQGMLVSGNFLVNPVDFAESRRRGDVILEIGTEHPICQALQEIELAEHPLLYQFSPRGQLILCPARNVRDA
jgi:hypothetical protein